jgi:hypothetical protein
LQYDGQRYYDPWVGGYIQPDPFGGAPDAPQGLNRYASNINNQIPVSTLSSRANDRHAIATSVNHGVLTGSWVKQQAASVGVSLLAKELANYSIVRLSVEASRHKLLTRLPEAAIQALGRNLIQSRPANRAIHHLSTEGFTVIRGQLLKSDFDAFLRVIPGDGRSIRWAGRLGDDFYARSFAWLGGKTFGALSAGAGDALIQAFWPGSGDYWTYQEKGLTRGQFAGRLGVAAGGGLLAWGTVELVGIGAAVIAGAPVEVPVLAGIGVFLLVEYGYEKLAKRPLYEWLDLYGSNEPQR